jgi:hypothetical protein
MKTKKEKKQYRFLVQVDGTDAEKGKQLTSYRLRDRLKRVLSRHKTLGDVEVYVDATNPDHDMSTAIQGALRDIKYLTGMMYTHLQETGNLASFYQDLCAIRDATKSMLENINHIDISGSEKDQKETRTVHAISIEQLDTLSAEALHLMAHIIAEQKKIAFNCNDHHIDKKEVIAFIKKAAFGITGEAN